jgi:anti-anti-sigma factor
MALLMHSQRTERPRGFRIVGEVDMSNQAALSAMLAAEVANGGDITLDLTELRFMDSSGIRVLFTAARQLLGRGRLVVTGAQSGLRRTFDVMGADRAPGLVIVDSDPSGIPNAAGIARDLAGGSHPVARARCACGCEYLYAADDLALFWEPGEHVGPGCSDHGCECHVSPLRG